VRGQYSSPCGLGRFWPFLVADRPRESVLTVLKAGLCNTYTNTGSHAAPGPDHRVLDMRSFYGALKAAH
jgi:hypothetical protein